MELRTTVSFSAQDVARTGDREEAFEFIKELDLAFGEWDFSLKLIEYAMKIRAEYIKECKTDGTTPDCCVDVVEA